MAKGRANMTNRKLKNASYNLQMQIVCKETMKNLMTLEIGLTKALKESKAKVKDFKQQKKQEIL